MADVQHDLDAVLDRWLRRYAGSWKTVDRRAGPVVFTTRYRYRPKRDLLRFNIIVQSVIHAMRADVLRVLRWLVRHLPLANR